MNNEKKTLYDISWKVDETTYREDKAYSYSLLSKFERTGFDGLPTLYDKVESPALLFGSIVDTLMTEGIEEFHNKYAILDNLNLSDSISQILRRVMDEYKDSDIDSLSKIPDNKLSQIGVECNYYANPKYDSYRVKKIREECTHPYSLMYENKDKISINREDYENALKCVEVLKTSDVTKDLFAENNPFDNIERFYQLKFKGTYENIPLRVMADLLIVNNSTKTIYPYDLKTSGKPEWNFYQSFITFRYDIQAKLYWYIIRQNLDNDDKFKNYKLAPYKFIVINKCTLTPIIWEYPDTMSVVDMYYGKEKQIVLRDWRSIVKDLDYYLKTNPKYPIGVEEVNDLTKFLNEYI